MRIQNWWTVSFLVRSRFAYSFFYYSFLWACLFVSVCFFSFWKSSAEHTVYWALCDYIYRLDLIYKCETRKKMNSVDKQQQQFQQQTLHNIFFDINEIHAFLCDLTFKLIEIANEINHTQNWLAQCWSALFLCVSFHSKQHGNFFISFCSFFSVAWFFLRRMLLWSIEWTDFLDSIFWNWILNGSSAPTNVWKSIQVISHLMLMS